MRTFFKTTVAAVAIAIALGTHVARAAGKVWTEAELLAANQARLAAFQKADIPAIDSLLDDQLLYTHATSVVENKAQLLASIKSGERTYRKIVADDLRTIVFPGGGIVIGHLMITGGRDPANALTLSNRFTAVLIEKDGKLKLVAFHSTRVPPPTAN